MDFGVKSGALETSFLVFWDAFERGMRKIGFDEKPCIYCIEWRLARTLAAKLLRDLHCKAFKNIIKKDLILLGLLTGFLHFWNLFWAPCWDPFRYFLVF